MNDQNTPNLEPKAALERIRLIHKANPHLLDERGYVICTNDILDDAQTFLRNNLDLAYAEGSMGSDTGDWNTDADNIGGYHFLTGELAAAIIRDLRIIWGYEYYRDEISQIAMDLSLCPMHFCDWMACFDDDDEECSAIRAIFPHSHDT